MSLGLGPICRCTIDGTSYGYCSSFITCFIRYFIFAVIGIGIELVIVSVLMCFLHMISISVLCTFSTGS